MTSCSRPSSSTIVRPLDNAARIRLALTIAAPLALAVGLWFIDPSKVKWFPVCPTYALTGLSCPGCGSTRALHHIAHGQLLAAWRMNPLLILLIVPLSYALAREIPILRRKLKPLGTSAWVAWAFLIIVITYGVARNIPTYPFTLLAPH